MRETVTVPSVLLAILALPYLFLSCDFSC